MHQQTEPHGVEVEITHFGPHRPEERAPRTPTEEFNEGLDWLHYSRAQAIMLADHIAGSREVDLEEMALAVEGVAAMITEANQRIVRANALLRWEWAERAK